MRVPPPLPPPPLPNTPPPVLATRAARLCQAAVITALGLGLSVILWNTRWMFGHLSGQRILGQLLSPVALYGALAAGLLAKSRPVRLLACGAFMVHALLHINWLLSDFLAVYIDWPSFGGTATLITELILLTAYYTGLAMAKRLCFMEVAEAGQPALEQVRSQSGPWQSGSAATAAGSDSMPEIDRRRRTRLRTWMLLAPVYFLGAESLAQALRNLDADSARYLAGCLMNVMVLIILLFWAFAPRLRMRMLAGGACLYLGIRLAAQVFEEVVFQSTGPAIGSTSWLIPGFGDSKLLQILSGLLPVGLAVLSIKAAVEWTTLQLADLAAGHGLDIAPAEEELAGEPGWDRGQPKKED